ISEKIKAIRESDRAWSEPIPCEGCAQALCTNHTESDAAALNEAISGWSTASMEERMQALVIIGQACVEHGNRANPAVLQFLVKTMNTEKSWHVRTTAAYALGRQPGHELWFAEVEDRSMKRMEAAIAARKKVESVQWELGRAKRLRANAPHELFEIEADNAVKLAEFQLRPLLAKLIREEAEWGALITSLGRCRLPKASKYLLKVEARYSEAELPGFLRAALLESPTLPRVQCLVDRLGAIEKQIKANAKEFKKVRKRKPRRRPKGYTGTSDMWEEGEESSRLYDILLLEESQEELATRQERLHKSLTEFATKRALKQPRLKGAKYHSCWKAFISGNKSSVPRTLGQ
ncbi:MAG: hypothetical protein P1V35_15295, partial [Planctomycetota bacterium]|nr:hypothetical protein [Planctomycetota bacterium]